MIEQAAMTRNINGTLSALVDEGFVALLVEIAMVVLLPLLAPLLLSDIFGWKRRECGQKWQSWMRLPHSEMDGALQTSHQS